jgi:hypothetical protein
MSEIPTAPDEPKQEAPNTDDALSAAGGKAKLSDEERAKLLVELWKQTVTVQQHFNDLSWRIRGLAMTALTFTLGAAAVAAQKAVVVQLFNTIVQLSALITAAGLVLWIAFFYVDRLWYHPLLRGSVKHGEELEKELRLFEPTAGLTMAISRISPYKSFNIFKWEVVEVHSGSKLTRFYLVVAGLLVVFAIALQLGAPPASSASEAPATTSPSSPSPSTVPSTGPPAAPAPTDAGTSATTP